MANTIWCVGRNYSEHAKEMGAEVPTTPLIFIKSWGSINASPIIDLPSFSDHIEHEIELAIKIDQNLQPQSLALALDLTARDIQTNLKAKGHPWTLAKSFKGSCLLSDWIPFKNTEWFENLHFSLSINGVCKQKGSANKMIFKISDLIDYLKAHFNLLPGDIILTGTPSGVSKLNYSDQITAEITDELKWTLAVAKS